MSSGDDPGIDPRLRAALANAPDGELRPAPAVRDAVLRAAHEATAKPADGVGNRVRVPGWRRWWDALLAPRGLATAAGIACVGIALKLAWQPEPAWRAETAETSAATQRAPTAPTTEVARTAPTAQAGRAAPERAPAPPPAPALTDRAKVATRPSADTPGVAMAPAEPPRPAADARPAPAREAATPMRRPAAAPPAPAITTATAPPPPLDDTPVAAAAPDAPAPLAATPPALAEAGGAAPIEARQAAKALAGEARARSRAELSTPAAQAHDSAVLAEAAAPGLPPALDRWATALRAPADDEVAPPAGWQLRLDGTPVAWGPAQRHWWRALIAGTAGRWTVQASGSATGAAWQLLGPEGTRLSLQVGADQVWLHSGGVTWRAPRPPGLPGKPVTP
jgi:hypothetical protein